MITHEVASGIVPKDDNQFRIVCAECGMVYAAFSVVPDTEMTFELPSPTVPCHAGSVKVEPGGEHPLERVRRLMGLSKPGRTFVASLSIMDGMIYRATVRMEA